MLLQEDIMKITNKNIWTILISVVVFLVLMVINFCGLERIQNDALRILLLTISSTVATVVLANVLWEVIAKENFAKSMLDQVKISENIAKSGIDAVYVDFRDIDWKKEFKNTKSFTAAFVYAYSWRSNNDTAIREFASKNSRRKKMRIIVPDPENNSIMSDLDRRFNFECGETRKRVEDCIKYYCDLGITVYVFEGTLQSSYYLMDQVGIMSVFTHSKGKGAVPALKANKTGNMYKYINDDLNALIKRSCRVTGISIEIEDGVRTTTIRRVSNE